MTAPPSVTDRVRPDPIRAVPVRRPWRWVAVAVLAVGVAMFVHLLVTNRSFQWRFMVDNMFRPPIIEGLRGTILLTVFSMLIGVALGIVIAVMRLSANPILSAVAFIYTWFFRAVPRLVLAVLFGGLGTLWPRLGLGLPFDTYLGRLFGIHDLHARIFDVSANDLLSGFVAGMLALSLSEAAYMAEIVRAGIQSVDAGQFEAAEAIGLTRAQTLRRVVLPQAMRVIVPPTGNETIAMLKDTSLVAYTPVSAELFFQLQAVGHRTFQAFPVLVAACLWYLFLSSILMVVQYFVERHFSRGYGSAGRARLRLRGMSAEHGTVVEGSP
ncbi:MAG: polar amino acid transport system permease protein [Micromonosporaceae bacterium]|jgi:polar amino acid transport system permease protein|nr:polar amino acid transport system permease protein [Micromonosporaceae bacterium]MDT5037681.1 polar amino acid transport system permease protein [Micromonosporaceae bacterium]